MKGGAPVRCRKMDCQIIWASRLLSGQMEINAGSLGDSSLSKERILTDLKEIWTESFQDSEEYIDLYLHRRFIADKTIVALCKGQPVGVAYLLPVTVHTREKELPAVFGYALGVKKAFRGQEISIKIIDYIYRYCDENSLSFLFFPANEKLAGYYESLGLNKVGEIKKCTFQFDGKAFEKKILLTDITAKEYTSLRDNFFKDQTYARWEEEAIDYAIAENRFCGGFCKKLVYGGREYAIFGHATGGELVLKEAIIPEDLLPAILQEIAAYFKTPVITIYLPADSKLAGTMIPWVMGYKAGLLQEGYCNLFLN